MMRKGQSTTNSVEMAKKQQSKAYQDKVSDIGKMSIKHTARKAVNNPWQT